MKKRFYLACFILACFVAIQQLPAAEETQGSDHCSIFLIGNSLTWDTVPSLLEEDVQWHVDCGKSLKFIFENPEKPCVKTSTLWPTALKEKRYDIISVQPHYGTTLQEDIDTISKWIAMQPQAVFIIHTGWARSATLSEEYEMKAPSEKMAHQPAYIETLMTALKQKHPDTEFRTTHAMRLLFELKKKIPSGSVPLENIEAIYRDAIHMTTTGGRYMMHNAMRETIGQSRSTKGFEKVPEDLRAQLDKLLDERKSWEYATPAIESQAQ